jgi:hypothetical protein
MDRAVQFISTEWDSIQHQGFGSGTCLLSGAFELPDGVARDVKPERGACALRRNFEFDLV